ncbi:PAS domain S-box protein [Deferribacteraceae bacterium V6Fe1]|nr:PAS domain S-box protein [Deferribacteraceae bacterium V6Fe1]
MKKLFLFILFTLITISAFAEHGVIKVGVYNNPPLSIINGNNVTGFAPEIFKYIARKEAIDYTFVIDSFNNLYNKIQNNEIDILLPIGYSSNRLEFMSFTEEPIFTNWGQIIANKNSKIKSIIDLENKKIALIENDIFYKGENALESILKSFSITYTPIKEEDYPKIAKLVSDGKVDAGLVSRIFVPQINSTDIEITNIILRPINVHFAFSKNLSLDIKNKINSQIKELKNNRDSFYYIKLNELFAKTNSNYKYIYKTLGIVFFSLIVAIIIALISRIQVQIKTKELKNALKKALENKNKLNTFINAMPDVAFVLDKDGNYIEVFSSNDDLLYDLKENLLGKNINEILPNDIVDIATNAIKHCIQDKKTLSLEYELDVIGGKKIFEGRISPIDKFDDNEYVLFLALDITERKKLESEIRYERDRFQTILKSIADAVLVIDKDKNITFINKTCEKLLEKSYKEIIGKPFAEEIILKTIDNQPYTLPFDDIFYKGLMGNLITDCKLINKNGKEFLIEDSLAPLYDAKSQINGAVIIFSDVTTRKKMEEEIAKRQYLDSIGRVAGGIAHDFNNYLAAISSYVSMCKLTDKRPEKEVLDSLENILKRATNLTRQLITFSKGGSPVKKPEDIKELLEETANFALSGTAITVNFDYEENLPPALIDSDQFSQVITNIIINAKEAMNNKGEIDIKVRKIDFNHLNVYEMPAGTYLEITIKDYGPGMSKEIKEKIFDPFFTTKSTGSGLGLATSYSIINKHKGKLLVYSEPGKGAEFKILIKAAEIQKIPNSNSALNIEISKYDLKILYLDDEESLRDSISLLLSTLGCKVDVAKNGDEAIELFKKNKYDLAILDLTIKQGLSGKEAAEEILKLKKDSYLVVTSGYSDDDIVANYKNYGFKDYLSKPFTLNNIVNILENYLKISQHD